jgi:pseudaminic acid synthase
MRTIKINGREIGPNKPPYVIAELSANHNGSLDRALATIKMAKECGACAAKLQTYTADTMTIESDSEDFQIQGGLWDGRSLYDLYEEAHTPFEWHKEIFEYSRQIGITCFSTPFDESAVELLEGLNTPAYKIASFEMIDLPLIDCVARTGKPMIISTGMANLEEMGEAVDCAKAAGCEQLVLLHCISGYPTPVEQANLRTIPDLAQRFEVSVGLSDHTMGTAVSVAAIAMGASVIEKHVTLSRAEAGPDSEFSLEPNELEQLCSDTKSAWCAMGEVNYALKQVEKENLKFRRSIYVVTNIKAGERFTADNIRRIRPGFGLPPKMYEQVIGKVASTDLTSGCALEIRHVDGL